MTLETAAKRAEELRLEIDPFCMPGSAIVVGSVRRRKPDPGDIEFIEKALRIVKRGGFVVMLLRLNFFGSEDRNQFFLSGNMPLMAYTHAKRLGFTPDGKTDSIEYMHAIWRNDGYQCHETKMRVLPY